MFASAVAALALSLSGLTPKDCADPHRVLAYFSVGLSAAKRKDLAAAKSNFDTIMSTCGNTRVTWVARVLRAEIALAEKDYDGALSAIAPVPRPAQAPIGSRSSWLALQALRAKGDQAGFGRERAALLAAVDRALSEGRGPYAGRKIETFTANGASVTAYEAKVPQGGFIRLMEMIVVPPGPMDMPISIVLTDDEGAKALAKSLGAPGQAPYFVDEYECAGHLTLKMLPPQNDQPPAYDQVKAVATGYLNEQVWAGRASPLVRPGCVWPQYVTPGLGG